MTPLPSWPPTRAAQIDASDHPSPPPSPPHPKINPTATLYSSPLMPVSSDAISALWRTIRLDLGSTSSSPASNAPTTIVLSRSSHSLALLGSKAYIFGGELKPRTPVGSELLEVDLSSSTIADDEYSAPIKVLSPSSSSSQGNPWPQPRVGASLCSDKVSNCLYLWGGRGGKAMAPLSVRGDVSSSDAQSRDEEIEDVWRFTPSTSSWELLKTTGSSPPQGRSYHTMTIADDTLYVHAGCPAKGRLNSLHSLHLKELEWKKLEDAPGNGRGGTVLAAIRAKGGKGTLLARWAGFCGYELGGPLDIYDPVTSSWTSHQVYIHGTADKEEPPKRSVHSLVPIQPSSTTSNPSLPTLTTSDNATHEAVAILAYGEGEGAPAELGHDGAGKFLSDVYLLLRRLSGPGSEIEGIDSSSSDYSFLPLSPKGQVPEARGWFGFDVRQVGEGEGVGSKTSLILHGGLNDQNQRLSDARELVISF